MFSTSIEKNKNILDLRHQIRRIITSRQIYFLQFTFELVQFLTAVCHGTYLRELELLFHEVQTH